MVFRARAKAFQRSPGAGECRTMADELVCRAAEEVWDRACEPGTGSGLSAELRESLEPLLGEVVLYACPPSRTSRGGPSHLPGKLWIPGPLGSGQLVPACPKTVHSTVAFKAHFRY